MIVLTLITTFYYVNMDVNKLRENFINVHCDERITQKDIASNHIHICLTHMKSQIIKQNILKIILIYERYTKKY